MPNTEYVVLDPCNECGKKQSDVLLYVPNCDCYVVTWATLKAELAFFQPRISIIQRFKNFLALVF